MVGQSNCDKYQQSFPGGSFKPYIFQTRFMDDESTVRKAILVSHHIWAGCRVQCMVIPWRNSIDLIGGYARRKIACDSILLFARAEAAGWQWYGWWVLCNVVTDTPCLLYQSVQCTCEWLFQKFFVFYVSTKYNVVACIYTECSLSDAVHVFFDICGHLRICATAKFSIPSLFVEYTMRTIVEGHDKAKRGFVVCIRACQVPVVQWRVGNNAWTSQHDVLDGTKVGVWVRWCDGVRVVQHALTGIMHMVV